MLKGVYISMNDFLFVRGIAGSVSREISTFDLLCPTTTALQGLQKIFIFSLFLIYSLLSLFSLYNF